MKYEEFDRLMKEIEDQLEGIVKIILSGTFNLDATEKEVKFASQELKKAAKRKEEQEDLISDLLSSVKEELDKGKLPLFKFDFNSLKSSYENPFDGFDLNNEEYNQQLHEHMFQNLTFGEVIDDLLLGFSYRREHWEEDTYIFRQELLMDGMPIEQLMIHSDGDVEKYIPSDDDLFAEDWVLYEEK
jgi:hypothetical protein